MTVNTPAPDLSALVEAVGSVAAALNAIGAPESTPPCAIEHLATAISEAGERLAVAIEAVAAALRGAEGKP